MLSPSVMSYRHQPDHNLLKFDYWFIIEATWIALAGCSEQDLLLINIYIKPSRMMYFILEGFS